MALSILGGKMDRYKPAINLNQEWSSRRFQSILLAWLLVTTGLTFSAIAGSDHEAECRAAASHQDALFELCLLVLDGEIEQASAKLEADPELVTATSEVGGSLMHIADLSGDKNFVEFSINQGADINLANRVGVTPLHLCAVEGEKEIAELLLKNGASVDTRDVDGSTPLVWAVARNHQELAEQLIAGGPH